MIITSDANLEKSIKYIIDNFLENASICIAGSILFIESKIYDKVKNSLIDKLKKLELSRNQFQNFIIKMSKNLFQTP